MKYSFSDEGIIVTLDVEGLSSEIKDEIHTYIHKSIKKEKKLLAEQETKAKKKEDNDDYFKNGYQALSSEQIGLHHPQSEFDIKQEPKREKPPKEFGVKVFEDGERKYQLFYICPESFCGHKGKRYVPKGTKWTFCHECNKRMAVDYATEEGEGFQDEYNNFYIAGKFQRNFNKTKTLAGTSWE